MHAPKTKIANHWARMSSADSALDRHPAEREKATARVDRRRLVLDAAADAYPIRPRAVHAGTDRDEQADERHDMHRELLFRCHRPTCS